MLSKISVALTVVAAVLGILDILFTDEQKARLNVRLEAFSVQLRAFGSKGFFHFLFEWKTQAILILASFLVTIFYILRAPPDPADIFESSPISSILRWLSALSLALIPATVVVLIVIPFMYLFRFLLSKKSGIAMFAGCLLPLVAFAVVFLLPRLLLQLPPSSCRPNGCSTTG